MIYKFNLHQIHLLISLLYKLKEMYYSLKILSNKAPLVYQSRCHKNET